MAAFDLDGLDVALEIRAGIDRGLAIEDADDGVVGIESVETVLEQLSLSVLEVDEDGVLFVDLIDFDVGAASLELDFGMGQIGRDHLHRGVATEPKKDAGSKENFGFTVGRGNDLADLHFGAAYGF